MAETGELFNWSEKGKYSIFSNQLLKDATFWERNKVLIITSLLILIYIPINLNGSQTESKKILLLGLAITGYAILNLSIKIRPSNSKTTIHVFNDRIERTGLSRATYCSFAETSGFQFNEIIVDNKKTKMLFLSNGPSAEFFILSENDEYNKSIEQLLIENGIKPKNIYQPRT